MILAKQGQSEVKMHATNILIIILLSWMVYLIGLVIYRLFFHPYARYPGPLLARVSYLYAFYHAWNRDTSVAQLKCHLKYGNIVRYNPDSLLFNDPVAFRTIYGYGKNFSRGRAYAPMNTNPHARPNLLFNGNRKDHAWRKRIISQAFDERALQQSQVYIRGHIDGLCEIVGKIPVDQDGKWSQATDMQRWVYWCIQDIITDLVFGRPYNMLTDPAQRALGDICISGLNRDHLVFQYPGIFAPGLNKWNDFGTWFMPAAVEQMGKFMGLGAATAMQRIHSPPKDAEDRKDVLGYLLTAKDPTTNTGLEKEDVVKEACILLLAGGSTTAQATAALLFYISRKVNAQVFNTLAQEIRSTFSSPEEVTLHNLVKCTYLHATITESLRLTFGLAKWRDAGPNGATVTTSISHDPSDPAVTHHYIPHSYTVGVSDFSVARNPNIFPDPYSFAPDRYIPSSSFYTARGFDKDAADKAYELSRYASHAFSLGPEACVAESLALASMQMLIAMLVWRFDVRQAKGKEGEIGGGNGEWGREQKDEYQWYGSFTSRGFGPVVQFRKREGKL